MTARVGAVGRRALLALLCGVLAACSSFDARWRAAEDPATAQGRSRWEGRWTSEKHTGLGGGAAGGKLRCVLEPPAAGSVQAAFRAHWKIFTSDYTMPLTPVRGSRTDYRGTHELPAIFGGTYRYTARIAGDRFTARYDSSYDHGTFTLERLPRRKHFVPPASPH